MNIEVLRRTVGVNFNNNGEAEITVWAPNVKKASILLQEKNKVLDLQDDYYGYYTLVTKELNHGDTYKFVLDNQEQFPDPASLSQPDGIHGWSEAVDITRYQWNDNDWNNHPLEEYIIYELHTGTFSEKGNFKGIEEKLDYLSALGITAIEIMPVAQFPGTRNWGYDGVYPFAVQHSYGGAQELQQLVDACHKKRLAVILDVVYNHMGPEGNYLGEYGPYFTGKYHTPWGDAINFDDAWCDGVRRFFIENALMWFRDFHIDALRMDAVHAIKDFSPVHILEDIRRHTDKLMEATGRKHYLIVECDLNDTVFINPLKEKGYGMDAQWMDEFHHSLRVTAGNERNGYYADFEGIHHLAKAYKDAYVYDGIYSEHRKKTFGIKAKGNPGRQFIVFSQNHDQVGNRMLGERTSHLVSFEMQKLMAGAVMISPYIPLLFMGEEWSESNPFQYFVSHTDPELVEAVRKGRKEEFASFHAAGEAPDPQAEATFNNSKLQWHLHDQEQHRTMLQYYKALIQLRKTHPVLNTLDRTQLDVTYDAAVQTLILTRWQEEEEIVCFLNFSKKTVSTLLPAHKERWEKIFDSAVAEWGGISVAESEVFGKETVLQQSESLLIYTGKNV